MAVFKDVRHEILVIDLFWIFKHNYIHCPFLSFLTSKYFSLIGMS